MVCPMCVTAAVLANAPGIAAAALTGAAAVKMALGGGGGRRPQANRGGVGDTQPARLAVAPVPVRRECGAPGLGLGLGLGLGSSDE
jgi:hypothetical protein